MCLCSVHTMSFQTEVFQDKAPSLSVVLDGHSAGCPVQPGLPEIPGPRPCGFLL